MQLCLTELVRDKVPRAQLPDYPQRCGKQDTRRCFALRGKYFGILWCFLWNTQQTCLGKGWNDGTCLFQKSIDASVIFTTVQAQGHVAVRQCDSDDSVIRHCARPWSENSWIDKKEYYWILLNTMKNKLYWHRKIPLGLSIDNHLSFCSQQPDNVAPFRQQPITRQGSQSTRPGTIPSAICPGETLIDLQEEII